MQNFTNYFSNLKSPLFRRVFYSSSLFVLLFALSSHMIDRKVAVDGSDDNISTILVILNDGSGFATYCEGETSRPILWQCAAPDDPNVMLTNGGTYSNLPAGAVANGNRVDIRNVAPGSYSGIVYTDNDAASSTGTLELTIVDAPNAGDQTMALVVCPDNGVITLADELQGEDMGGDWSAAANPMGGTFNAVMGTFNPSGASVGSYFFFYDVAPTVTGGTCEDRGVVEVIVGPVVEAFAIQASCNDMDMPNDDAYIQLSAVTGGDRFLISDANGSVMGDYSSAQDISAVTFPFIALDNITNPAADETYTVRVFAGSDACFTDVTVTLSPQTCVSGCDCEEYVYLNDTELSLVHKFETNVNGMGMLQEVFRNDIMGRTWLSQLDIPILNSPHGLGVDQNGNFFIGDRTSGRPIYWVKPDGTLLLDATNDMGEFDATESFLGGENGEAPGGFLHIYSDDQNRLYIQGDLSRDDTNPDSRPEVAVYDICTAIDLYDGDPNTIPDMSMARIGSVNRQEIAWGFHVNGNNLWGGSSTVGITDAQRCETGMGGNFSPVSLAQSDDLINYDDAADVSGEGIFDYFPIDQSACKPDGMGGTTVFFSKGVHQAGDFLYVVYSTQGGNGATNNANGIPTRGGSYIAKYQLNFDANGLPISGTLVAESAFDNDPSDGGWFGARGIAVDEDGFIYVSARDGGFPMGMSAPGFTCLVVFEDNGGTLTEVPGTRVSVPVGVNSESKGLSIAKECCPASSRASFEVDICESDIVADEKIFLSNLISECAGGRIGEGEWTQEQGFSGIIYDDCDNSITLSMTDGDGCAIFTLSSDGTADAAECDAFVITFTVCIEECGVDLANTIVITSPTPAQGFYDDDDPIEFTVSVFNQGTEPASDLTIANYFPAELENFSSLSGVSINGVLVPGATITSVLDANGNPTSFTIDFGTDMNDWLQPDDVVTFTYTADITDGTPPGTSIVNTTEISSYDTDDDSLTTPLDDVDSTPDAINGNGSPGAGNGDSETVGGNLIDNEIGQNGLAGGDEDDHDIAIVEENLVLPVELLLFTAKAQENDIRLDWVTASELNNAYFDLERSEDSKNFKAVTQLKGQGTTLESSEYTYMDRGVEADVDYYYRLKQVDIDGTFEYSDIVTARIRGDKRDITVYPNPVGGESQLTVELYVADQNMTIEVYDMHGTLLTIYEVDQNAGWITISINTGQLSSGTYFLKTSDGNVQRFVKL